MRTKSEIISLLTNPGIVAVVRAQKPEQVLPLSEALIAGGVSAVEITMTTPNAIETIRQTSRNIGARGLIGVGTVLDARTCSEAIEAGAEFVVSPILRPEIVQAARGFDPTGISKPEAESFDRRTAGWQSERAMKKLRWWCLTLFAVVSPGRVWSQTPGLAQRVPNTTLRMPASPPVYGYATPNAFTNL